MITDLSEILIEWSYRTHDGIPDVNNNAKLILLEGVLTEFGWSREAKAELLNNLMEAKADVVEPTLALARKKAEKGQTYSSPQSKKVYTRGKEEGDEEAEKGGGKDDAKTKLLDSIENPDKPGEIWSLDRKTKKWTKKDTKLTRKENAEIAIDLVDDMETAIKSGDEELEKKALKDMMDSGLFSVNAPGVDTKKLYMGTVDSSARKRAGKDSGKDTGRIDSVTGINYLKFGDNNKFAKNLHKLIEKHGDSIGNSSFNLLGDKTGKKRMNPDNLYRIQSGKGEKAPTKKVEVKKNKAGVIIGNFKMDSVGSNFVEKEVERMKKAGISESDVELYKKTVIQHNKKVKKFQEMADANEGIEVFEILDEDGKALDPADENDRKKMPLQIVKMLNKKYNQLLGNDVSKEIKAAMNNFEKVAEDFANGKDSDGSKFREERAKFFEAIHKDPETRPSISDVAETLALASDLSRGRFTVLPSKSNFAVGDVLSSNMRAANVGGNTKEEISESLKILFITASGLTSLKFGKGGSSQGSNKVDGTDYNGYTNKDGIETSSEEVKKDLMDLSTTSYDELWSFSQTEKAKNRTDELQKKYDVTDCPPEPFKGKTADADARKAGYLYSDCSEKASEKREEAWKKRASGAKGIKNIEDCDELNKAIPKEKENGSPYSKKERLELARKKMVETYREQERAGRTLQIVNNRQMESQIWTNRVYEVLSDAAAKKAGIESGESKFNLKETNGVNVLGGMDFTENPGYDGPCGKPVNKMSSRITTVKKS